MVIELLKNGARLEEPTSKGRTALHIAAENDKAAVVYLFVAEQEMSPLRRDRCENSPLHAACEKGALIAIKYLIALGADVNARGEDGRTPLHVAVINYDPQKDFKRCIKKLLIEGADQ